MRVGVAARAAAKSLSLILNLYSAPTSYSLLSSGSEYPILTSFTVSRKRGTKRKFGAAANMKGSLQLHWIAPAIAIPMSTPNPVLKLYRA